MYIKVAVIVLILTCKPTGIITKKCAAIFSFPALEEDKKHFLLGIVLNAYSNDDLKKRCLVKIIIKRAHYPYTFNGIFIDPRYKRH